MTTANRQYIAIDLKSFYASVECVERGLDPLTTHLVVADPTRTEKTICLAVTPALKAHGISGRPRLFEVIEAVRAVNSKRRVSAPDHKLSMKAIDAKVLENPNAELDYLVAPPQMALYMRYSTRIYDIYLRFISKDDIHVYSVDEVFIDATRYLRTYGISARELALRMVRTVHAETGITATAGIGTNLYLAKIAMDIVAKKMPADADGVRIAELDRRSFREKLWGHRPITDFWRVGRGYRDRLASIGIETMGDVARRSITDQAIFYDLFGVNAELLIDHAWGEESCTIEDIKNYRSESHCVCEGQVLQDPYTHEKARLVVWEMADNLSLQLFEKGLKAEALLLQVGYDIENLDSEAKRRAYHGDVCVDIYGRKIPKPSRGMQRFDAFTASTKAFTQTACTIFDATVDPRLLVRRINLTALNVVPRAQVTENAAEDPQPDLFADAAAIDRAKAARKAAEDKESRMQQAILKIKRRYGKNALLRGKNFLEGATAKERNAQIGGHKA